MNSLIMTQVATTREWLDVTVADLNNAAKAAGMSTGALYELMEG